MVPNPDLGTLQKVRSLSEIYWVNSNLGRPFRPFWVGFFVELIQMGLTCFQYFETCLGDIAHMSAQKNNVMMV